MTRARGVTLIEMMVALAIVGGLVTGATLGLRAVAKTELRAAAGKLAASMRYLHDRARATSRHYRLVIDLDEGTYWAEESDDRFYLQKDAPPEEAAAAAPARKADEDEERADEAEAEISADVELRGDEPWQPRRARFTAFKDAHLKTEKLAGIKVAGVATALRGTVLTGGRAFVHFFPQGFGERAVIELADSGGAVYSLVNHPLTGRVRIIPDRIDARAAFDDGAEAAQ